MSSAAEAELGALYIVAKECVYIRLMLKEMGHRQPATPLQTDNTTAEGVINNKIQPRRTKAIDMRFHWLRDRKTLLQFCIYWRSGKFNLADYFTKHHPVSHHRSVQGKLLTSQATLNRARAQRKKCKNMMQGTQVVKDVQLTEANLVKLHPASHHRRV